MLTRTHARAHAHSHAHAHARVLRRVGASIGARVAPAGLAKLRCEAALPGVALLAEDGEHPSAALTHVQVRSLRARARVPALVNV